jgi:mRNA interferase MazF
MPSVGQTILFEFPQTNGGTGKLRPALLLGKLPGGHDDWLICMISSKLHQFVENFDEILSDDSEDFASSGLKSPSVVRIGRLAVVDSTILVGAIGEIAPSRLERLKTKLANWLTSQAVLL